MTSPGAEAAANPAGRRRGLRFRFVIAFAVGSFMISGVIGIATYLVCQRYLVDQRERALVRQGWSDARLASQLLAAPQVEEGLSTLQPARDVRVLVRANGRWLTTGVGVDESDLPASTVEAVRAGSVAHQRIRVAGSPVVVVGIPLPELRAQFYEVSSIQQLDETLRTISWALVAGGAVATMLAVLLALRASRIVLRPLTETALAAERVAGGDFDTRIDESADPDLASVARSFNRMVDVVEQRLEREARFSSDVSHELRSPITTLAAATELMQRRRDRLPPDMQELLGLLRADIERFSQLVQDLLEISRADAGVEELRLEPVLLEEFVSQCLRRNDEDVSISVADDARAPVLVDKRRLARVVENLVTNARAYAGGLTAIRIVRVDGCVRIEAEDAGPGVALDERDLIFERFHRGTAAGARRAARGSGLGLSLVAEQVRLHGGRVHVRDADAGHGACFVVELPWRSP